MLVATVKVHGPNGLWSEKGSCEYNLAPIAATVALALVGPGAVSGATASGISDVAVLGSVL